MLFSFFKGNNSTPEFTGNKTIDLLRYIIYYFIIFSSKIFISADKYKTDKKEKKYLFVYRDWSEETTLVREFILTLKESLSA